MGGHLGHGGHVIQNRGNIVEQSEQTGSGHGKSFKG